MIKYVECGCCGYFHKEGYCGDCRNDDEQYTYDDIEFFATSDDFEIIYLED